MPFRSLARVRAATPVRLEVPDDECSGHHRIRPAIRPERDRQFQFLGLQTLYDRYVLHSDGTRFELPLFVFQGEHDSLTPVDAARRFLADVVAPVKEMALIADATHFASFWRPGQFLELLLTRVRPYIAADRGAAGAR